MARHPVQKLSAFFAGISRNVGDTQRIIQQDSTSSTLDTSVFRTEQSITKLVRIEAYVIGDSEQRQQIERLLAECQQRQQHERLLVECQKST